MSIWPLIRCFGLGVVVTLLYPGRISNLSLDIPIKIDREKVSIMMVEYADVECKIGHITSMSRIRALFVTVWARVFSMARRMLLVCCLMAYAVSALADALPVNTKLGGAFELTSTHQNIAGVQDFAGKVVLLNFGYTSCPDVCPMVLARLAQLNKQLGSAASEVQTAFVTVDPTTDTVDKLTEYLRFFNADFVGFSGTEASIATVARQYGVMYMAEAPTPTGESRVAHSDFVYLLDRQGRVRKVYSTTDSLQQMQTDIRSLLNEGRSFWSRFMDVFE